MASPQRPVKYDPEIVQGMQSFMKMFAPQPQPSEPAPAPLSRMQKIKIWFNTQIYNFKNLILTLVLWSCIFGAGYFWCLRCQTPEFTKAIIHLDTQGYHLQARRLRESPNVCGNANFSATACTSLLIFDPTQFQAARPEDTFLPHRSRVKVPGFEQ
jgi:hypothetical protein